MYCMTRDIWYWKLLWHMSVYPLTFITFNPPSLISNWWSLIHLQFSFIGGVWDGKHLECTTSTVSVARHPFGGWCCSNPCTPFRDLGFSSSRTLGGRCVYQSNPSSGMGLSSNRWCHHMFYKHCNVKWTHWNSHANGVVRIRQLLIAYLT